MNEPVDERDHTSGVREDLVPLAEGLVGRQDDGFLLVPAGDHFKEEIGVFARGRQISHFVYEEHLRVTVATEVCCTRGRDLTTMDSIVSRTLDGFPIFLLAILF